MAKDRRIDRERDGEGVEWNGWNGSGSKSGRERVQLLFIPSFSFRLSITLYLSQILYSDVQSSER